MCNLSNNSMYTDDIFPRGIVQEFDGFLYTTNSTAIEVQEGDLVLAAVEILPPLPEGEDEPLFESEREPQMVFLVAICLDKNGDTLTLNSNKTIFESHKAYCRRLTFTIPTDLSQPAFSN